MTAATVIAFDNVTKVYRDGTAANTNVTFTVAAGEVVGLLGPNGAGKSTIVNQLVGLATPTAGTINVGGCDVVADPRRARSMCAVQPQTHVPSDGLTPREFVEFVARLRGCSKGDARVRTNKLFEALDIAAWADRPTERLSGGVVRLVAFTAAAVAPAAAVVLDEPTNDVDPLRRRLLWQQVRELGRAGAAVLLVTHNVAEAEHAVDRVAILDRGRIVATGRPSELKQRLPGELRLAVRFVGAPPPHLPVGEALVIEDHRAVYAISVADATTASDWAVLLRQQGLIDEFTIGPATLEDAYADHLQTQEEDDASLAS